MKISPLLLVLLTPLFLAGCAGGVGVDVGNGGYYDDGRSYHRDHEDGRDYHNADYHNAQQSDRSRTDHQTASTHSKTQHTATTHAAATQTTAKKTTDKTDHNHAHDGDHVQDPH